MNLAFKQSRRFWPVSEIGPMAFLTGLLVLGMCFGVPAMVWASWSTPIPSSVAIFGSTVVVVGVFGVFAVLFDRFEQAVFIATFVLSTFWINPNIGPYVGALGGAAPQLWVVYGPLAVLVVMGIWKGYFAPPYPRVAVVLAVLGVWCLVLIPFTGPSVPLVAVLFGLFVFQQALIVLFSAKAVKRRVLSVRSVVAIYVAALVGQMLIGLVEFVNRGPLGFSGLGESAPRFTGTVTLGPLGTFPTGAYVSGFTGGGPLSSMLVLFFPLVIAGALTSHGRRRIGWTLSGLLMAFILWVTDWDAAVGGILLAVGLFVVATGLWLAAGSRLSTRRVVIGGISIVIAAAVVVGGLLSLSTGGSAPHERDIVFQSTYLSPEPLLSVIGSLSVPGFDLSHLSIRVYIWTAGADLFLKNPIFGIGGGNFRFFASEYGLPRDSLMHNAYLGYLSETGSIGLVLFMIAVIAVLVIGVKTIDNSFESSLFVIAGLCGLLGVLAMLNLNSQYTRIGTMYPFWAVGGALVGLRLRQRSDDDGVLP